MNYSRCKQCVLDLTVPDITFDSSGICNYCHSFDVLKYQKKMATASDEGVISKVVDRIKSRAKGKYDCVIGMSGGVDSTYLALVSKRLGLKPLAVHVDAGWNSEVAVSNIEQATAKLNIDLETVVIDWSEMRDLQRSYFLASVVNCDVPQDHAFVAAVYEIARNFRIKTVLSGHNYATESILPPRWVYDSRDLTNIRAIHDKYGQIRLKTYPQMGYLKRTILNKYIHGIESIRLLNHISYQRKAAIKEISDSLGWRPYGDKHHESIFTKIYQTYYLPQKFNIDKRKAHLSNLILNNEITRDQAKDLLELPLTDGNITYEIEYLIKKLGFSKEEWSQIMKSPINQHDQFKCEKDELLFKFLSFLSKCLRKKKNTGK